MRALTAIIATAVLLLSACGGGGDDSSPPPPPPPVPSDPLARGTPTSPFAANCDGVASADVAYINAEVEPSLAVNPTSPAVLIGAWQQDRWSNGGARGVLLGNSSDGGHTWTSSLVPFSRCTGGNPANGGDYTRATDPWLSYSPSGTVFALALVFSGETLAAGSSSAMRVARSVDGGTSWSAPQTLIQDGDQVFNDKGSITADPTDSHFVYVVWDRVTSADEAPTWLARSIDGGASWETARLIFDPGTHNQTIGNLVVVLPNGTLVLLFTELDTAASGSITATLRALRSTDHGLTWSEPINVASVLGIGASDPETGTPVRDAGVLASAALDAAGNIYIVWQDARFSAGARDGIALSRSTDSGLTWAAPAQINTARTTQAFLPTVHVRADGLIGVTHYDFRNNTANAQTLPTDVWLLTSTDATTWTESHVTGPFDLAIAPQAGGLFLGDYQALGSAGTTFLPFFAMTNSGNAANRTDIFIAFSEPTARAAAAPRVRAATSVGDSRGLSVDRAWQQRIEANIERFRRSRFMGK